MNLDEIDRKLLRLLSEDASRSYAELGRLLALSAPAVYERVKKLKKNKVITAITARIDGTRVGRPLLAFILVSARSIAGSRQVAALGNLSEIEEIHSITGENGILLKVRVADPQALERLLAKIQAVEGVDKTISMLALSTLLERGACPEVYPG